MRKVLITTGDITSPITQKALKLKGQGMSIATIVKKLHVSTATVSTYLPYDGIIKNGFDPALHTQLQIDRANIKCRELYRPVTLAADGEMLLDDIGGVSGYADFLDVLNDDTSGMNEEERAKDKAERKEILDWARNIHGWRKLSPMI